MDLNSGTTTLLSAACAGTVRLNKYKGGTIMVTLSKDLNNSLINWIVKHIKSEDVKLGKFLKNNS
jgi:hemerythrin